MSGNVLPGPWTARRVAGSGAATETPAAGPTDEVDEGQLLASLEANWLAADEASRRRIRESLDESLLVEAAAGTGKTTELVARMVAVLASGRARIDQLAALTFTHKAAGEMRLRLRRELAAALAVVTTGPTEAPAAESAAASADGGPDGAPAPTAQPPGQQVAERLTDALARIEEARIGTIHAFCADLLRERPLEAGIDPGFVGSEETQAKELYRRVFRRFLEDHLDDLPPGLRRALARVASRRSGSGRLGALDTLADAGWKLAEWRTHPAAWRREPDFDRHVAIDRLLAQVDAAAAVGARAPGDPLGIALRPAVQLADWCRRSRELSATRDDDALEARLIELTKELRYSMKRKGTGSYPGNARDQVVAIHQKLVAALLEFAGAADADLAAALQGELAAVVERYTSAKRAAGLLDFTDLLALARDLLRRDPEVRRHLAERFRVVFVDEFQDTDPVQVEILLLLTADDPSAREWRATRPRPGALFLVGDPKQSIYRFRRADVVLYHEVRDHLAERGVGVVHLARNFRSVHTIQRAVNAAFATAMAEDRAAGQPGYVPLAPHRADTPGQPALLALPVPRPVDQYGKARNDRIEESLPAAVAGLVAWLVRDSGWQVADPERPGEQVAIAPRHVCLLFRRFSSWSGNQQFDTTRPYVEALERCGLPYALVGTRSFHQREEVEALRVAARAVEWPDDELLVYAALRGPFCAATDEQLLRARSRLGRLHPFIPLPADFPPELGPVAEGLRMLADLHRRRNAQSFAATLAEVLAFGRAHAGLALRPAGAQALAHVAALLAKADLAERSEVLSFRAFVERLEQEAERGDAPGTVAEGSVEGVNMLTLHNAKGLEFPVVVLADPTAALTHRHPDQHVDATRDLAAVKLPGLGLSPWDLLDHAAVEHARDLAEGVRIAYVAATRARDLLVVPVIGSVERSERSERSEGWGGGADPRWIGPLGRAMYPPGLDRARPTAAQGCPPFGRDSVVVDPDSHVSSVAPGAHQMPGGYQVVWWDPAVLPLPAAGQRALSATELLRQADTTAVSAGRLAYESWSNRRTAAILAGARATTVTLRPSEAPPAGADQLAAIELVMLPRDPERPSGPRFGVLVHAVLAAAPLGAAAASVATLAAQQGRILGANEAEVAAAARAASAALDSPVVALARRASRVHREIPISLPLPGGELVEGVIDLAFLLGADETSSPAVAGGWVVVDFKTDLELRGQLDSYRRQVAWYVTALAAATGQPARGVLLAV